MASSRARKMTRLDSVELNRIDSQSLDGEIKTVSLNSVDKNVDSLTIHGIPRIITSNSKVEKLFWLSLFLFCFCYCAYSAIRALKAHYSRDTFLHVSTKTVHEMPFPSVTICNKMKHNSREELMPGIIVDMDTESVFSKGFVRDESSNRLGKLNFVNFDEFSIGYDKIIRNVPRACRFGYKTDCSLSYFSLTYDIPGCITFNARGNLKQIFPGSQHGVKLIVYVNHTSTQEEDVDLLDDDDNDIAIVVHDPKVFPNLWSKSFSVETGLHNKVAITKKRVNLKRAPFASKCVNQVDRPELKVFPGRYTTQNCLSSCSIYHCYDTCGDVPGSFQRYFTYKSFPRKMKKNLTCVNHHEKTFFRKAKELCDCPLSCEEVIYDTTISVSKWPTKKYEKTFRRYFANDTSHSSNKDFFSNNFLLLSVYFEDFLYKEEVEKEKYSFDNLMGDLGGQAGLYMGASIFSVIELLLILVLMVVTKLASFIKSFLVYKK